MGRRKLHELLTGSCKLPRTLSDDGTSKPPEPAPAKLSPRATLSRWLFLAVPAVALVELTAHLVQSHGAVPESDWQAAKTMVAQKIRPDDLLLFAPKWADPVGRAQFGDGLASLQRTARPDETRFPRAIEVGLRGRHRPELQGWKKLDEERVGRLVVATYENPSPARILDDLLLRVAPGKMSVYRVDDGKETPCTFVRGRPQAGGLGAGPALPADRFTCDASYVGLTVIHSLDHDPRLCLIAPPFGGATALRVRFHGVRFGAALHGHHGLQNEAERDKSGAPVVLVFRTEHGGILGRAEHKDGTGWVGFEFDTGELKGKAVDLTAEITAANASRRHYCFEADTR